MKIDLSGRVALVTGAAGELGRVMCRSLAACGADLILHYQHSEARAQQLLEEITAMGRRAIAISADVGDAQSMAALAEQAKNSALGLPDIVVLNAVYQIHPWSSIIEEDLADYESQFRTCVMQAVHLVKNFVPSMQAQGWGRFIAVNTECSLNLLATESAYGSAKRALDGVMRVLVKEVGANGVTVNQVAPGWTISERHRNTPDDDADYIKRIPLGRRGTDQEIANVIAFLASDLASFVHGAFVPVNGGTALPTI